MNRYHYSPLQPGRDEIRLVKLQPGPATANLEIEIFHAKLSSSPTYEALSCVWGSQDRTNIAFVLEQVDQPPGPSQTNWGQPRRSQMDVNSKSRLALPITRNLAIALRHLKCPASARVLWIDAICINQDDLSERSSEVLNMDSIYSKARQVTVWLGPSRANSSLALETLRRLGEGVDYSVETNHISYKPGSLASSLEKDTNALKSNANSWIAIKNLIHREWFSRLWVFQEIGLATNAIVVAGKDCLDWQVFTNGLLWVWVVSEYLNEIIENLEMDEFDSSNLFGFLTLSKGSRNGRTRSVFNLLELTTKLSCSDARDRLYAIRSLVVPQQRSLIVPDYSKSVKEVYKAFTLRLILENGYADILRKCVWRNSPSILEIPSWVPDISFANPPNLVSYCCASGYSEVNAVSRQDDDYFGVQGINAATVTHISSLTKARVTDCEIIKLCQSWEQLISPTAIHVGGGLNIDAFVEALLSGEIAELMPLNRGNYLSLEECKIVLEGLDAKEGHESRALAREFATRVRKALLGRAFFQTNEGFFGLCPEFTNPGDRVAIILGCSAPLVLRPVVIQEKCCFRVVGECYVPGLMCTEGLLGPLPLGWRGRYELVKRKDTLVFVYENATTQQDPRLPLPSAWRYMYGSPNNAQETETKEVKDMTLQ